MKKFTLISLTILAILLSACSAQTTQAAPAQAELSTESKLIVGTFKLDGTEQAVTKDQAKQLVIMWKVYQEISQSDTAAQEEVDGLLKQIKGTMTDAQMQAINDLSLSQRDVMSLMQEKGLMAAMPARDTSSSDTTSNSGGGFTPPDGGGGPMMGAGGPPDMAGGGFGGGGPSSSSSSSSASSSAQTRVNPTSQLLDALIEYLQGIAGE